MLQARMPFLCCLLVTFCLAAFSAQATKICVNLLTQESLALTFPDGNLFFEAGGRGRSIMITVEDGRGYTQQLSGPAVIIDDFPSPKRARQTPIHLLADPAGYSYGKHLLAEGTPLVLIPRKAGLEAVAVAPPHPIVVAIADAFQEPQFMERPSIFLTRWTSHYRMQHERVHVGDRAGDSPEMNSFVQSLNAVHSMDNSFAPQLSAVDTFVRELRAYDAEYTKLIGSKQKTIVLNGDSQYVGASALAELKGTQQRLKAAYPTGNAYFEWVERQMPKFESLIEASGRLMDAIESNRNEFGNASIAFPLYRSLHVLEIETAVRHYAFQANQALNEVRERNLEAYGAMLNALWVVSARNRVSDFRLVELLPVHFR
jgi:hypothetical protein